MLLLSACSGHSAPNSATEASGAAGPAKSATSGGPTAGGPTNGTTVGDPTNSATAGSPTKGAAAGTRTRWILNSTALGLIANSPGVRSLLDSPSTYVVVRKDLAGIPSGWSVTPVVSYTSYAAIAKAIAGGQIPAAVKTVMYDDEVWSFTPRQEQQNPGQYIEMAGALLHAHGYAFISAPATNLGSTAPSTSPDAAPYARFLGTGIYAAAARSADVVDIQAQGSISTPSTYIPFVNAAAAQLRSAAGGRNLIVLAGLSTNPAGPVIGYDSLQAAISGTRSAVSGYWLNIPQPGQYCPKCNPTRPDLAVRAVQGLQ